MIGTRRVAAWSAAGVLAAVVAALQILRVNALYDQGHFEKYLDFARRAAAGSVDAARLPDFSPGYAWLLTLLHGHLGLDFVELRALQIALVPLSALAAAFAAERAAGSVAAWVAGISVAASRAALLNATEFEPESWIFFLCAVGVASLMGSTSLPGASFAGLAFGLAAIFRPSGLLIVVALSVWLGLAGADRRRALSFVAMAAAPVLVILVVNVRITGTPVIMDPGTVFYEGMNPLATGYSGVQPAIVNDLEEGRGVDALHVTYRMVAARALGESLSTNAANRFWTTKALAFARLHPLAAVDLTARKVAAAVSSYDAWDLVTIVRKERELSSLAVPFGLLFALSVTGLWFGDRTRLAPVALVLLCTMAPMVVFYVTARQRNAAIPAAAVLAGCAVSAALRDRRAALAVAAALVAGALLTVETRAATEDRHQWRPYTREAMLFDEALRLERAHEWGKAERILLYLADAGYQPERRTRTPSSISYHLARVRLRQQRPGDLALLLERARAEAPGDSDVLALSAAVAPAGAAIFDEEAALLHDPFTIELSRVRALIDTGRRPDAFARTSALLRRMPEWRRPAEIFRTW